MKKLIVLAILLLSLGAVAQEKSVDTISVKKYHIYDMEDNYLKVSTKSGEEAARKMDSLGLLKYKLLKEYSDGTSAYCIFEPM